MLSGICHRCSQLDQTKAIDILTWVSFGTVRGRKFYGHGGERWPKPSRHGLISRALRQLSTDSLRGVSPVSMPNWPLLRLSFKRDHPTETIHPKTSSFLNFLGTCFELPNTPRRRSLPNIKKQEPPQLGQGLSKRV